VAAAKKLSGIHKIFRDAAPLDKTCLIGANEERDRRLKPVREDFCKRFHKSCLEREGGNLQLSKLRPFWGGGQEKHGSACRERGHGRKRN